MRPLRLTATSGRIRVVAEPRDGVLVELGEAREDADGLEVRGASGGVGVRVPVGTDLVVGTRSGLVTVTGGELGTVGVTTRSGRVQVGRCAELDVRTGSGRIEVGEVAGAARIRSTSGRIEVDRVGGTLRVDSRSGRVRIGDVAGAVDATTVDGRVGIGLGGTQPARCASVTGRIDVSVPPGVAPRLSVRTVSGRCTSAVPEGSGPEITARTVSGRIDVRARTSDG